MDIGLPYFGLLITSLGNIINAAGSVVGVRIFSSLLSIETFALVGLVSTLAVLNQRVVFAGITSAVGRYLPARMADGTPLHWTALRRLCTVRSIVIVAVSALSAILARALGQPLELSLSIVILGIVLPLQNWAEFIEAVLRSEDRKIAIVGIQALSSCVKIAGPALLCLALSASVSAYYLGLMGSAACTLLLATFIATNTRNWRSVPSAADQTGEIGRFAFSYIMWGIPAWLLFSAERLSLSAWDRTTDIAYYNIYSQISIAPVSLICASVSQFWSPRIYRAILDLDNGGGRRTVLRLVTSATVMCMLGSVGYILLLVMNQDAIIDYIVDKKYRLDPKYLVLFGASGLFYGINGVFISYLATRKDTLFKAFSCMVPVVAGGLMFVVGGNGLFSVALVATSASGGLCCFYVWRILHG